MSCLSFFLVLCFTVISGSGNLRQRSLRSIKEPLENEKPASPCTPADGTVATTTPPEPTQPEPEATGLPWAVVAPHLNEQKRSCYCGREIEGHIPEQARRAVMSQLSSTGVRSGDCKTSKDVCRGKYCSKLVLHFGNLKGGQQNFTVIERGCGGDLKETGLDKGTGRLCSHGEKRLPLFTTSGSLCRCNQGYFCNV